MKLVEAKKISLDDPVAKYIREFQDVKVVKSNSAEEWGITGDSHEHLEPLQTPMTIRHLLTHTSGLSYGPDRVSKDAALKASSAAEGSYLTLVQDVDSGRIRTLKSFCEALAQLPLRFQPGAQWMYSHGVDVAGRIIEIVSQRSLEAFLQEEVLQPLSMTRTTFFVPPGRAKHLAAMYLAEEHPEALKEEPQPDKPLCSLRRVDGWKPEDSRWCGRRKQQVLAGGGIMGSCAGGLVSCLQDMALFLSMLSSEGKMPCGRRLLKASTIRHLLKDWLSMSSVVGHDSGRRKPLQGWPYGPTIGWNPLGHIRKKDQCLYMGGWSTSWAIYPKQRLATLSMSQSLVYFDIPGWIARKDELDAAVEFASAQHRRRLSALGRHRAATTTATTTKAMPSSSLFLAPRMRSQQLVCSCSN